jgi:hypothetical protein
MSPAQRRRRDVLIGLLAAAGLTFLMAVMAGSIVFWVLQLLTDVLLGGYVFLLRQHKAKRQPQRRPAARPMTPLPVPSNVHHLDTTRRRPAVTVAPSHVDAPREATVLALRRTASW